MASGSRPFRRVASLGGVFKKKRETPYQNWEEDEQDTLLSGPELTSPYIAVPQDDSSDENDIDGERNAVSPSSPSQRYPGNHLQECFYLGSYDMSGLQIRGRGCIDTPCAHIWERSQQEKKHKRKNSWPTMKDKTVTQEARIEYKPRYVSLVAGPNDLNVYDNSNSELLVEFSYRKISFVGTHPKHKQLLAFISESKANTTPFCHAFKCDSKEIATTTANAISNIFQQKIKELLELSEQQKTICIDARAVVD